MRRSARDHALTPDEKKATRAGFFSLPTHYKCNSLAVLSEEVAGALGTLAAEIDSGLLGVGTGLVTGQAEAAAPALKGREFSGGGLSAVLVRLFLAQTHFALACWFMRRASSKFDRYSSKSRSSGIEGGNLD